MKLCVPNLDGAIVLWKLNENSKNMGGDFDEDFGEDIVNKENWVMHKMLRYKNFYEMIYI